MRGVAVRRVPRGDVRRRTRRVARGACHHGVAPSQASRRMRRRTCRGERVRRCDVAVGGRGRRAVRATVGLARRPKAHGSRRSDARGRGRGRADAVSRRHVHVGGGQRAVVRRVVCRGVRGQLRASLGAWRTRAPGGRGAGPRLPRRVPGAGASLEATHVRACVGSGRDRGGRRRTHLGLASRVGVRRRIRGDLDGSSRRTARLARRHPVRMRRRTVVDAPWIHASRPRSACTTRSKPARRHRSASWANPRSLRISVHPSGHGCTFPSAGRTTSSSACRSATACQRKRLTRCTNSVASSRRPSATKAPGRPTTHQPTTWSSSAHAAMALRFPRACT
mmetsp:Transcript_7551/g.46404  ORF Transcript_7551/g.46404 Transcript_7551/m.46404 type:complete len:336 (+) Transcript_7551:559-1566(+)